MASLSPQGPFLAREASQRPPTGFDDYAHGYSSGDGYAGSQTDVLTFGDLWNFNAGPGSPPQIYQQRMGAFAQADWQRVDAALPCDGLTTACGVAISLYQLRAAYTGNAATIYRYTAGALASMTLPAATTYTEAPFAAANAFCSGTTGLAPCWVVPFDQSANNYAITSDWGVWSVTLAGGGTGYTSGTGKTFQLNMAGCTTVGAPAIVTGTVTAGILQASGLAISGGINGQCDGAAGSASQTASTSSPGTAGAGTTAATFTVVWTPMYAPMYSLTPNFNGLRSIVWNTWPFSAATNTPVVLPSAQNRILRVATFPYTTTTSTVAWAGDVMNSMFNRQLMRAAGTDASSDGIYMSSSLYPLITFKVNPNVRCFSTTTHEGVAPIAQVPAVAVINMTGTMSTSGCWDGNRFSTPTSGTTLSATSSTGFIIGADNTDANASVQADMLAYVQTATAASASDINTLRIGLTKLGNIVPQGTVIDWLDGDSLSSCRGVETGTDCYHKQAIAQMRNSGGPLVPVGYNTAISGQTLAQVMSKFTSSAGIASLYYNSGCPYASACIVSEIFSQNDTNAACPNGSATCNGSVNTGGTFASAATYLWGLYANVIYTFHQLSNAYHAQQAMALVANGATISGAVAGDRLVLTPPSGVTCTAAYNGVLVNTSPTITVQHVAAGVPDEWNIFREDLGNCIGSGLTGSGASIAGWAPVGGSGSYGAATFTLAMVAHTPIKVVGGTDPVQNSRFSQPNIMTIIEPVSLGGQGFYAQLNAEMLVQPATPCSTSTTCAYGSGLGADGIDNMFLDPVAGPSVWSYSSFANSWCSGDGSHPTAFCQGLLASGDKQAVDALVPFP